MVLAALFCAACVRLAAQLFECAIVDKQGWAFAQIADRQDLSINNGATVTGYEIVDGRTVRFLVSVPDAEAIYRILISREGGAFPAEIGCSEKLQVRK